MDEAAQHISNSGLILCYTLFLLSVVLSQIQKIQISRELVISTVRMSIQLVAVGFVLKVLFDIASWFLIVFIFLVMVFFGAQTIYARVGIKQKGLFWLYLISLLCSAGAVMAFFTFVVVRFTPWYEPRYFIPLVGMIIGNSMNGTALAFERFYDEVKKQRKIIETYVSLGANTVQASESCLRIAYRASLLPTISSMTGMGLVFLPGMMTGQIIGGSSPLLAIKYQIAIVLAILGSVSLSSFIILRLERRQLFDQFHLLKEHL